MTEETKMQFNEDGFPVQPSVNEENDNSSASSAVEETPSDTTPSSEEDNTDVNKGGTEKKDEQNFADHPRWKEREEDWKERFNQQEERHTTELTKIREEIDNKFKASRGNENIEIPSWFGSDDPEVWKAYQADLDQRISAAKKAAKEEALGEITSKTTAEQKAINDATEFLNEKVSEIETDKNINPEGVKVDRNKLLKFVLDNELVDTKGRWNYRAGWIMMNGQPTLNTNTNKDKKNLAGATISDKGAETKPSTVMTSEDFSKPGSRPW